MHVKEESGLAVELPEQTCYRSSSNHERRLPALGVFCKYGSCVLLGLRGWSVRAPMSLMCDVANELQFG